MSMGGKLDSRDFKILKLLSQNSRISNSAIAKQVKISKQAVKQRIDKLKYSGTILSFSSSICEPLLGKVSHVVLFELNHLDKERKDLIRETVAGTPSVSFASFLLGQYSLWIYLVNDSLGEFEEALLKIISTLSDSFKSYQVLTVIEQYDFSSFGEGFKINNKHTPHILKKFDNRKKISLTDLEKAVTESLKKNSRDSLTNIAKKCDSTQNTVLRTINNLVDKGLILKHSIVTNLAPHGRMRHYCLVSLNKPFSMNTLLSLAQKLKNISVIVHMLGSWNFNIVINSKDSEHLSSTIEEIKKVLDSNHAAINVLEIKELISLQQRPLPKA